MRRFHFIFVTFVFLSCQGEELKPNPDSFCIFKRVIYTDSGDIGKQNWTFLRCDDNPNYQIQNTSDNKGYATINCNCSKQP